MEGKAKIFVKIQDYKDIKDILSLMQQKIGEAKAVLERINDIRTKEDKIVAKWGGDIKDIEERLVSINNSLSRV